MAVRQREMQVRKKTVEVPGKTERYFLREFFTVHSDLETVSKINMKNATTDLIEHQI